MAVTLSYNGISGEFGTLAVRTSYGSNTAGAFLTSVSASQIYLTGGAEWQGNTSQFIARSTTGGAFESFSGTNRMYTYTGATVGNSVSMQLRFYMASGGNSVFGDNISTANYRLVAALPGSGSSTDGLSVYNDNASGYGGALNFEHRLTASGSIVTASRINSEGSSSSSFVRFFNTISGTLTESFRINYGSAPVGGSLSVNTTNSAARVYSYGSGNQHGIAGIASSATGSTYAGVYGEANISSTYASCGGYFYSINANTYALLGYWSGSAYFTLYGNGSTYISGTYQGSDSRLKENIVSITGSLDRIKRLNPVKFNWKANSEQAHNGLGEDYGLIAQEVMPIIPEIIKEIEAPDNKKPGGLSKPKTLNEELGKWYAIEYSRLIPHVIQAIQELSSEVDTLKTQLATSQG